MHTGNAGISLIKKFESCSLTAYKLKNEKYWTIGWGHYGDPSVGSGTTWTRAHADQVLRNDLGKFELYVETMVKIPLNQNRFDALVSYVYNRGPNGLRQLVNASKTIPEFSENIVRLWGTNAAYKNGLTIRRKCEQSLFDTQLSEDQVVQEVCMGFWGNGDARKRALKSVGLNPEVIQKKVNLLLKH